MGLFGSIGQLFGKPQMGGNTAGLEGNFDRAFPQQGGEQASMQGGLNINPKLAMLSQIFANMGNTGGGQSPVWQAANQQQQERTQAEQQRQQAQAAFENARRAHQMDRQFDNANPSPSQPYRTEDNVGNVWEIGPDGQPKLIFTDKTPKYHIQGDQAIEIPNQYANQPATGGTLGGAYGGLPPGYTVRQQSAAPAAGGQSITQEMWNGAVSSLGAQGAEEWRRRNNITVGGR